MQKALKAKLEKMTRDQLMELIEELCRTPDTQKLVNTIVAPKKTDVDRLVQKLAERCEIFMCNSCNANDYGRMEQALIPIISVYRFADMKTSAYITWKTYLAFYENDFEDYYDLIGDMLSNLGSNLERYPETFTEAERIQYTGIL